MSHNLNGWGSFGTNSQGQLIFEYIISSNMQILNVGNSSTFINKSRSEIIHITFSTEIIV